VSTHLKCPLLASTIEGEWNAENAAEQFISLVSQLLEGKKKPVVREKGVCSKAEILKG